MSAWLRHHARSLVQTFGRLASAPLTSALNLFVIGIALALPLGSYALLANLQGLLASWPSTGQVSVFLDAQASRDDARHVEERLRSQPGVKDVRFVSREAALAGLRRSPELGDVVAALRENPLPDAVIVNLAGENAGLSERVAAAARGLPKVAHVQADAAWARRLAAVLTLGRTAVALLTALLGIALVAVVFNTIRLQILTQRAEIEVARLVGATDSFIRRPFYYWGFVQGVLGGLVAVAIVSGSLWLLDRDVAALAQLYGSSVRLHMLPWEDAVAALLFSGVLGGLGAYLSVSRHLHELEPR